MERKQSQNFHLLISTLAGGQKSVENSALSWTRRVHMQLGDIGTLEKNTCLGQLFLTGNAKEIQNVLCILEKPVNDADDIDLKEQKYKDCVVKLEV